MSDDTFKEVPPNPNYGNGIFRRRILLEGKSTADGGSVLGQLEDTFHGFRVTVFHQDRHITQIDAEPMRIPLTTCSQVGEPVQALIGASIDDPAFTLNRIANPKNNCTHLLDLTILAINHCARGTQTRQYDVEVLDEKNSMTEMKVSLNDQVVHAWQSKNFALFSPANLEGNTLFRGFAAWANPLFKEDELEAAFVLQKGNFVAQGRRFDIETQAGKSALEHHSLLKGACYTYTSPRVEKAIRLANTTRDFSEAPEQLLKFV